MNMKSLELIWLVYTPFQPLNEIWRVYDLFSWCIWTKLILC